MTKCSVFYKVVGNLQRIYQASQSNSFFQFESRIFNYCSITALNIQHYYLNIGDCGYIRRGIITLTMNIIKQHVLIELMRLYTSLNWAWFLAVRDQISQLSTRLISDDESHKVLKASTFDVILNENQRPFKQSQTLTLRLPKTKHWSAGCLMF